jgi:hypothetical protein
VRGYEREALQEDYRVSVLMAATIPVLQHGTNMRPAIRWNHLERIPLAVDDPGCRELLAANR